MSGVVIEAGPVTVRGPYSARPELAAAAVEYVDDDLGLLDERAVSVADLWVELVETVAGAEADVVVLVCPTWWPSARISRVRAAAAHVAAKVVVWRRGQLLLDHAPEGGTAVVEVACELVVVSRQGADAAVIPILGDMGALAAKVRVAVGVSTAVLIDASAGVDGAGPLAEVIADRLRANGIAATRADEGAVRRAAAALQRPEEDIAGSGGRRPGRRLQTTSALAGVVVTVAVCGGFALRGGADEPGAATLLVEGRIGVLVPAAWPVQRITSGPGSARLQAVSPSHSGVALHVTQSVDPARGDLATTAESLRAALADEPGDVFVDFNASDMRAGRPVVTYREVRPDRHVGWAVLADRSVRIAIGCQSPPARDDLVREVCDQAIRSAHAVS